MKFYKVTNQFHGNTSCVGLGDPFEVATASDGQPIMAVIGVNKVLEAAAKFLCSNWTNPENCPCKQELSPKPFGSENGDSFFLLNDLEVVDVQGVQL